MKPGFALAEGADKTLILQIRIPIRSGEKLWLLSQFIMPRDSSAMEEIASTWMFTSHTWEELGDNTCLVILANTNSKKLLFKVMPTGPISHSSRKQESVRKLFLENFT